MSLAAETVRRRTGALIRSTLWLGAGVLASVAALRCTEEVQLGDNGRGGSPGVRLDASAGDPPPAPELDAAPPSGGGASGGAGATPPCVPLPCQQNTAPTACGNCIDDDGDDFVDSADPECLGPCDDDESAFTTGAVVSVLATCRTDCYFDRNAGRGNDGCDWNLRCDPLSVPPDYAPTGSAMCEHDPNLTTCEIVGSALDACNERCIPLTPNGCDCFGCCELPAGSGRRIWLGSPGVADGSCDPMATTGPTACPACTPAPGCDNPCEDCELCVGRNVLPAACGESGAMPLCPDDRRACDPMRGLNCTALEYCITGCCAPLPQ